MSARRFAGRRALVTGASGGIGAAIAERLAAEGADVVITARTLDQHDHLAGSLRETQRRLARYGTNVAIVVADLAGETDRARIVPEAVEALGAPIEILVNNAAAAMYQPLAEFPLRRRRVIFEANIHAPLDLAQAVIPAMLEAGEGWIVNLASGSARLTPGPPFDQGITGSTITIYGASKAALNRITRPRGRAPRQRHTREHHRAARRGPHRRRERARRCEPAPGPDRDHRADGRGRPRAVRLPREVTGRITVSVDLLDEWHLATHALDGTPVDASRLAFEPDFR